MQRLLACHRTCPRGEVLERRVLYADEHGAETVYVKLAGAGVPGRAPRRVWHVLQSRWRNEADPRVAAGCVDVASDDFPGEEEIAPAEIG